MVVWRRLGETHTHRVALFLSLSKFLNGFFFFFFVKVKMG
jgi:hypothetical protein